MNDQVTIPRAGVGELLTPSEAAMRTGLKEATLAQMRCRGDGPAFHKISRFVRYDSVELERWMRSRRFRSTAEAR
jgi:hypothetical protein